MKSWAEIGEFIADEVVPPAAAVTGVVLYLYSAYWMGKQADRDMGGPVPAPIERSVSIPVHFLHSLPAGQERQATVTPAGITTDHPRQR